MIALLLALLVASPPETLQTARPQLPVKLRRPDEILADYVRAVGGKAAWSRHSSVHMKRKLEVRGQQIGGTEERWASAGDKMVSVTSIENMGTFRQGSNGKVAWSEDPINGLRILDGAEAEEARIEAAWNGELRLKQLYAKLQSVPPPEPPPAGRKYECVELIPKLGRPAVACFDAETHLRTVQQGRHTSPQGDAPYKVTFSDWKKVEGLTIPHGEEMTVGPMTLVMTISEIKLDEKIDPKVFALPEAAKAAASVRDEKN